MGPTSGCPKSRLDALVAVVRDRVRAEDVALVTGAIRGCAVAVRAESIGSILCSAFRFGTLIPSTAIAPVELWRPPRETMAAGSVDAGSLAILAASMLVAVDIDDVWIVDGVIHSARGIVQHAWVEGTDVAGSFFLECTTGVVLRPARPPLYVPQFAAHPVHGGVKCG